MLAGGLSLAADDVAAMYKKALADFNAGRYAEAEAAFLTIYRTHPDSRYAPDAAFKAGEAAFRHERYAAAVTHFSHYLRAYPLGASAYEAQLRLEQARGRANEQLPLPDIREEWDRPLVAWYRELPAPDILGVERLMAGLARLGYNAVAVPVYRLPPNAAHRFLGADVPSAGAYFATDAAPVCAPVMAKLVTAAHKAGLRLIGVLPTRAAMHGLEASRLDRQWDPAEKKVVIDQRHLDIFQPENLARLAALAGDLARAGVDGIWLDRDLSFAPNEGLAEQVLQQASAQLGHEVSLDAAFAELPVAADGSFKRGGQHGDFIALCEIRAARINQVIQAICRATKKVHPSCRMGVVLPIAAAIDQVEGLRDRSIDADALAALPLAHLVGWADWRRRRLINGLTAPQAYDSMKRLSVRMRRLAGSPNRAVVAATAVMPGGERLLPEGEMAHGLGSLLDSGPLGIALYPDVPNEPVSALLSRAAAAMDSP